MLPVPVPIAVDCLVIKFGLSRKAADEIVQEILSVDLIKMSDDRMLTYNSEVHHCYVEEYYKKSQTRSWLSYIIG